MRYLLLGAAQALNFLLIVTNIRALNRGFIAITAVTDFVICLLGFWIIRTVAEAHTVGEALAYATGGALGSVAAILLTRKWDQ